MISTSTLVKQLGSVDHFRELAPSEVDAIVRSGKVSFFNQGKVIFSEEEFGVGLCVLISGRIQLCVLSPQGQISILAIFEPVIMFNEVAALDGGSCPATAIALEDTVIWQLPSSQVENLFTQYPKIGLAISRVLARRNRALIRQYQDLSFRSVLGRSAGLLLKLSNSGKNRIDRRKYPNHQLASMIATIPEGFSRCLRVFRSNQAIHTTNKFIEILNPPHLEEINRVGPHPTTFDN